MPTKPPTLPTEKEVEEVEEAVEGLTRIHIAGISVGGLLIIGAIAYFVMKRNKAAV